MALSFFELLLVIYSQLSVHKNDFNTYTQSWHILSAVLYNKKQKSIVKLTTKTTKSDRQIKVDNLTHYLLKPLIDNSTSDYIFKYSEDLSRAEHYVSRFKKYCKLAGVKTIRFHDLRHSHASLLIASREDRFTVSKRLGHSSTTFTETIYGHLFPDKQNSITSLLEETFKKDFKKSVQFCAINPEKDSKSEQKKDTKNVKFVGITMFIP
ncbi:site-specific integrase [Listeria sp. FSL L7-1699]|uniref:Site-specific integrase n=1 Tax=Listeria farberi TaxID=2713500 RepID=A0ABR6SJY4_9LIST|nr:site-specific integrase [Listeria farberi]MBC1380942.1 site-specific integrase [Listeria farberi]